VVIEWLNKCIHIFGGIEWLNNIHIFINVSVAVSLAVGLTPTLPAWSMKRTRRRFLRRLLQ